MVSVCLGAVFAAPAHEEDERTIRGMIEKAISRLNRGDPTAFDDFWAENTDYVGVDGTLIKGRLRIQDRFRKMTQSGTGQQTVMGRGFELVQEKEG